MLLKHKITAALMIPTVLNYLQPYFKELHLPEMRYSFFCGDKLFHESIFRHIHEHTQGYPRRIAMFCHKALKYVVMKNKPYVDQETLRDIIDSEAKLRWQNQDLLLKSNY
jgi:hypothetical protein